MITLNKAHTSARARTHRHNTRTVGRRELYLETLNTDKRQISMPPTGYEPAILVVNGLLIWLFWQSRLRSHHLHYASTSQERHITLSKNP